MPARMLGLEGGWIVRSHIGWREERSIPSKVWKPLPSGYVLKMLRGNPRGKTQSTQYLLTMGLGCYTTYYNFFKVQNLRTKIIIDRDTISQHV